MILVWCMVAVFTMFTFWAWPRTWTGLLLAFTVLPVIHATVAGLVEWTVRWGPITRFHERLERRTSGQRISAMRIFVHLTEVLIIVGAGILLWLGLLQWAGVDTAAVEAFMNRHFWP